MYDPNDIVVQSYNGVSAVVYGVHATLGERQIVSIPLIQLERALSNIRKEMKSKKMLADDKFADGMLLAIHVSPPERSLMGATLQVHVEIPPAAARKE